MRQIIYMIAYGAFNFVNKEDGKASTIYSISLFISMPIYFHLLCITLFYFKRQGKVEDLLEIINNYTLVGTVLLIIIVALMNLYLRSINLIDRVEEWRNGPGKEISLSKINWITFFYVALSFVILVISALI